MSNLWVMFLIAVFLTVNQGTRVLRSYRAKREFDNKESDKELLVELNAKSLSECSAMCQIDCFFFGFNPSLKKCRTHKKFFTSEMDEESGWRYYFYFLPVDCKDLRDNGYANSGVFEIYPYRTSPIPVNVYCDMETMDGGWTVIQKRVNGSLSFNRNWTDYKNGFGSPEQDVWIGNDVIHQLTKGKNSSLYVSITLMNGSRLYELYDRFYVSNEVEKYQLFLSGNATGNLGDSMLHTGQWYADLSGMYFSTPDRDHDRWSEGGCATKNEGGWWFNQCYFAFLNGRWVTEYWWGPWFPTVELGTSVRQTMMMIKHH